MEQRKLLVNSAIAAFLLWAIQLSLLFTLVLGITRVVVKVKAAEDVGASTVYVDASKGYQCLSCDFGYGRGRIIDFWVRLADENLNPFAEKIFPSVVRRGNHPVTFSQQPVPLGIRDESDLVDFWARWLGRYPLPVERRCSCVLPLPNRWRV